MPSVDALEGQHVETHGQVAEAIRTRRTTRLEILVRRVLVTLVLACVTIAIAASLAHDSTTVVLALLNIVTYVAFLLTWGTTKRMAPLGASAAMLGTTLYAMARGSGIHDVAIVILPAMLLVAGLVVNRRLFAATATLTGVSVVVLGGLQLRGSVGTAPVRLDDPLDFVTVFVVLCAVAALIFFIVESLGRSLESAEANERAYREIFDSSNAAIFIHDAATGRILDVNATMLKMYGYQRDEALSLGVEDLSAVAQGYDEHRAREMMQRTVATGPQVFEWLAEHRDGSHFWVEVTLQQSNIRGKGRVLAVARNIQERRELAEQARQAEKMQAVGQLAGGVAHDFNNQLAGIIGYAELMRLRQGENKSSAEYIDGILTSAKHAADLTAKLLAFARKGKHRSEAINLHQIIHEVVGLLERSIDRAVSIEIDLRATSYVVVGDPSLLQNALLNLGLNARDALPNGGVIRFASREGTLSECKAHCSNQPTIAIEVQDTGIGMDSETAKRVFEPFFTTKSTGTGMGLAAVYGTIHAHHGDISVDSVRHQGSTFRIFLPVRELERVPGELPAGHQRPSRFELRVLFAEDEIAVAGATILMLKELGCTVAHYENGALAAERYALCPDDFDIALLDLNMPRMGGAATVEALRSTNPRLPIIVASGYDSESVIQKLAAKGQCAFIAKPFHLKELSDALQAILIP